MNCEQIIQIARKNGGRFHGPIVEHLSISEDDFVNRLAPALIAYGAAYEREQCAKVCEKEAADVHNLAACIVAGRRAATIRARGEKND
jgi:hypothetical protein